MTELICRDLALSERLVEYADGELPAAEVALMQDHLTRCAVCRRELGALSLTLDVAHREWLSVPVPSLDSAARNIRALRLGAALRFGAAALLIAIFGGVAWRVVPPLFPTPAVVAEVAGDGPEATPPKTVSLAAIEAELNQESSAARLFASAEVLANQPGAETYAARSFRFITEVYPCTQAGLEAARRLAEAPPAETFPHRSNTQFD